MEPTSGIKTSEGVTAAVTVATPLIAALAKLDGWQLVAALGVAALVASVYISMRTWLKVKGIATAIVLALFLVLPVSACSASTTQALAVSTIATVQSVDEGISIFAKWAVAEEDNIAQDAIVACHGSATRAAYVACTDAITEPRRAPIDKAKQAIRIYRGTAAAGSSAASADIAGAAQAVVDTLRAVGILKAGG